MNARSPLTIHDLLLTPAHALQARQILVMTAFLVAGIAVYDLFVYLSHLVAGNDFGVVYRVYGFFPSPDFAKLTLTGKLIAGIGVAAGLAILLIGMTAVAAFNAEQIRGNRFLRIGEAIRFAITRSRQLIIGQATIVGFILFIFVLLAVGGLIARIPYLGQPLLTLLFVFPLYIIAFFTVLILLVLQASWVLMPAVSAWDRKGESLVVLLETFSTVIRRPFHWVGYTLYSLVAGKVSSFVYAYLAYRTVQLAVWGMGRTDGGRMELLTRQALGHLPLRSDLFREMCTIFPGADFGFSLFAWARAGGDSLTSHLMAFMLFLIIVSVIAYFVSTLVAGQVYAYGLIKYTKDSYRVDQEKPLFTYDPLPEGKVPDNE